MCDAARTEPRCGRDVAELPSSAPCRGGTTAGGGTRLQRRRRSHAPRCAVDARWVPRCDTLHTLVRAYRTSRSVLLNVEHRLMLHFAPDLESLTLLQRMEAIRARALAARPGHARATCPRLVR